MTGHFFSVDVEEHFQVSAFEGVVRRADWHRLPSRVERSVGTLLDLLARRGATATFFTLGWVGKAHPGLVRRIVAAGHEIASHGWWHRRVTTLTPLEFRQDVRDARALLEDLSGLPVNGYRAPSFSITPRCAWAFEVLVEEGYRYDSSVFPIRRPGYGFPGAPDAPHVRLTAAGPLRVLPLATARMAGLRLPGAGGGYLRHLPLALTRRVLRSHDERGIPAMMYVHPWEIDPDQPRMPVSPLVRIRHYRGLDSMLEKLEHLLSEFHFSSVAAEGALDLPEIAPARPERRMSRAR